MIVMESETYRKFLKSEAEKNPVRIEESMEKERFRISWQNVKERPIPISSSDIIDSLYLGEDMQETVIMDRRVAATLQDRLKGLEEENIRMRRRVKVMKLVIGALLLGLTFISLILLRNILPKNIVMGVIL